MTNNRNAKAQRLLGDYYAFSDGVTKNYTEAFKWYKLAAEQGNGDAEAAYGGCFYNGNGTTENFPEAIKWFTLAANQNHAYGQAGLGASYKEGNGVPQNNMLAYMWFTISKSNIPEPEIKEVLKGELTSLEREMTPAEIAEAQQMAVEWLERH